MIEDIKRDHYFVKFRISVNYVYNKASSVL